MVPDRVEYSSVGSADRHLVSLEAPYRVTCDAVVERLLVKAVQRRRALHRARGLIERADDQQDESDHGDQSVTVHQRLGH